MASVCLLLMVKDEGVIIDRCLSSALEHVDEAVICDTGSTDDTIERAERLLRLWGKPFAIHREKWVNFGHNRTKAMEYAKDRCDYTLFLDADHELKVHNPNWKSNLVEDIYLIRWDGGLSYRNPRLTRNTLQWEYKGPTHEFLNYVGGLTEGSSPSRLALDDISIHEHYDGSSRSIKYERDIELLKNQLRDNPEDKDNPRWLFYLAQSFWDLKQWDKALPLYLKRATLGGWSEEVYYSLFRAGLCCFEMDQKWEGMNHLLRAHAVRPTRNEAIFSLCFQLWKSGNPLGAYLLGDEVAFSEPPSEDVLFIHKEIYDWRFKDLMSVCAWSLGKKEEGTKYLESMINVPEAEQARIDRNKMWFLEGRKMPQETALNVLKEIGDTLTKQNVNWWLHAGTLLGAVRDGDFIKHDTDLDLGVEAKTMNSKVISELTSKGYKLTSVWGRLKDGFEFTFEKDGIRCDLFFFYEGGRGKKGKKWHSLYHDWNKEGALKTDAIFEPFEIEHMEFLQHKFPVPTEKENYLAQHYGDDWKTTKTTWNYATDGPNLKTTKKRIKYTETKEDLENFIKQ